MGVTVPLSVARNRLFELFDRATVGAGEKVFLSRRGRPQTAVLVSAEYLARLEAAGSGHQSAGSAEAQRQPHKSRFHMAHTITIIGNPETVVEETRAAQNALAAAKLKRLGSV